MPRSSASSPRTGTSSNTNTYATVNSHVTRTRLLLLSRNGCLFLPLRRIDNGKYVIATYTTSPLRPTPASAAFNFKQQSDNATKDKKNSSMPTDRPYLTTSRWKPDSNTTTEALNLGYARQPPQSNKAPKTLSLLQNCALAKSRNSFSIILDLQRAIRGSSSPQTPQFHLDPPHRGFHRWTSLTGSLLWVLHLEIHQDPLVAAGQGYC